MMPDQVLKPVIRQPTRIKPRSFGPRQHTPKRELPLAVDSFGDQDAEFGPGPDPVQPMQVMATRVAGRTKPARQLGDGFHVVR